MRHLAPLSRPERAERAEKTFAVFTPLQIYFNLLYGYTEFVRKLAFPQPEE